jgi:hypothetical protein
VDSQWKKLRMKVEKTGQRHFVCSWRKEAAGAGNWVGNQTYSF